MQSHLKPKRCLPRAMARARTLTIRHITSPSMGTTSIRWPSHSRASHRRACKCMATCMHRTVSVRCNILGLRHSMSSTLRSPSLHRVRPTTNGRQRLTATLKLLLRLLSMVARLNENHPHLALEPSALLTLRSLSYASIARISDEHLSG